MDKLLPVSQVSKQVWRGPAPTQPIHFAQLQRMGVDTILSLERGLREWIFGKINHEVEMGTALGMRVIHIEDSFILPPTDDSVDAALEVMGTPRIYGTVYIHCKDGVDRTGYNCAAFHVIQQGWPVETAIKDWFDRGFHHNRYFWWVPHLEHYLRERGHTA